MKIQEMLKLAGELSHKDLIKLKGCLEHEIVLSETAIKEGFEKI